MLRPSPYLATSSATRARLPEGFNIEIPKDGRPEVRGEISAASAATRGRNGLRSHDGPARGRPDPPVDGAHRFLGAGKTTLLNAFLNGDQGMRVGVLVNASARSATTLSEAVIRGIERPEYLLVEASGRA